MDILEQFSAFFLPFGYAQYFYALGFVALTSLALYILTLFILGRAPKLKGDFWEHQNLATSKVLWLNALFFALLCMIVISSFCLFQIAFLMQSDFSGGTYYKSESGYILELNSNPRISLFLSVALLVVVVCAYFLQNFGRKTSIDKLAKTLEATEITHFARTQKQKMLMNIIEEMSLAANLPLPRVFVMCGEKGINAMCSGENFGRESERIAIFVTQGALENFTRDELQGVIAHEFSHAFYGDVALNLKIASLVFALEFVSLIGAFILKNTTKTRRNRKDSAKGMLGMFLIALVFYALGALGAIFAQIIQAAISRQKEYLADATSVQFTRNIEGIKSALKRLRNIQNNANRQKWLKSRESSEDSRDSRQTKNIGAIGNPKAKPCAHMFFIKGFGNIFATHPSLDSRIERLNKL